MLWIWLVLVLLALWLFADWWFRVEAYEKIPGPKGVYLLGNGFDFLVDRVKLFNVFRRLSNEYKDFYKIKLGFIRAVAVLKPEVVEAVISGSKNITKGYLYFMLEPWLKDGLLLSDERSKKLVEKLRCDRNKEKINISAYVTDCTLNAICETAMGIKLDSEGTQNAKHYKENVYALGELLAYRGIRFWLHPERIFNISQNGRKTRATLKVLKSFRDNVIEKRRVQGPRVLPNTLQEDVENEDIVYKKNRLAMLDLLLQAEKEGVIDAEGIKEEVDTFMFEGHDTVGTSLQFTFMLLANNPRAQEKVFEECNEIFGDSDRVPTTDDLNQMKYLECCIKESLRLYPPVYFILRKIDQDLPIGEYTLPKGTECGIPIYDMQRRADQFVEPLEFRPERFMVEPTWHPYAYIPFSVGPRNCIGQRFAMMEMKIVVSAVMRQYRLLPVTRPSDLVFTVDLILRTKDPVYVQIEHR